MVLVTIIFPFQSIFGLEQERRGDFKIITILANFESETAPMDVTVSIPEGTSVPDCEHTNECYLPHEVSIAEGGSVIWNNDDTAAHTVTSGMLPEGPSGVFDSGLFMPGASFESTFHEIGEYDYFCSVHPWMTGKITVIPKPFIFTFDNVFPLFISMEAVVDYFNEVSYGQLNTSYDSYILAGVLPKEYKDCEEREGEETERDKALREAKRLLLEEYGINTDEISGDSVSVVLFADFDCGDFGGGNFGVGGNAWLRPSSSLKSIIHELSHTIGTGHGYGIHCLTSPLPNHSYLKWEGGSPFSRGQMLDSIHEENLPDDHQCTWIQYADPYSPTGHSLGHLNAVEKEELGWLAPKPSGCTDVKRQDMCYEFSSDREWPEIQTVTRSGIYEIEPIETNTNGIKALKIKRSGPDPGSAGFSAEPRLLITHNYLYLEYRQPIGFDTRIDSSTSDVFEGITIHALGRNGESLILDATPNPLLLDFEHSVLPVGDVFEDPFTRIQIELLSTNVDKAVVKIDLEPEDSTPLEIPRENWGDGSGFIYFGGWGNIEKRFLEPRGITVDTEGNIYVADGKNNRIQKFDNDGNYISQFVGPNQRVIAKSPSDVTVDTEGNIYVANTDSDTVTKLFFGDPMTNIWNTLTNDLRELNKPSGVTTDNEGNIYVADTFNHRIIKISNEGDLLLEFGEEGSDVGQLKRPYGVTTDNEGNIYVADTYNDRIQKFDNDGNFLFKLGERGSASHQFVGPRGIAVDNEGNIYVADTDNHRIKIYDKNRTLLLEFGSRGSDSAEFLRPWGIALDTTGDIFISDADNNRVYKFFRDNLPLPPITPTEPEDPPDGNGEEEGGGCLIATAAYGSELAPQVQFLREIRDNTVMSTSSGASFMTGFNQLYYSFSPQIADMERENPMFQEAVRAFITPMISSLSIMSLAENGNEVEVLGLGISVIVLNLGMYVAVPILIGLKINKRFRLRN